MKYDVYFHNDFDGRASAAIMLAFLRSRGDDIEHFVPVRYDLIPQWINDKFFDKHKLFKGKHNPAIIVDFPFHPQAAFWFDHHIRPFRKEAWAGKFTPDAAHQYNDTYRSACHLVFDSLQKGFGWKPPKHLFELVKWLNIVDFADYKSAKQTIDVKDVGVQANVYIENTPNEKEKPDQTVKLLSEISLSEFVKIPRIKKQIDMLRRNMSKSLDFQKKNVVAHGRTMVLDLTKDKTDDIAYFGLFALYPKALYAIRYNQFPKKPSLFHINIGTNPWRRKENKKNIGEFLKLHNGGGHKDVGGAEIVGRKKTMVVVEEAVKFLNA